MMTLQRTDRGIIILEILLALALIGTVGVALTMGLKGLADNTLAARKEVVIMRNLESLLTEIHKAQELEEGVFEIAVQDEVYYERIVEPLEEMENYDGILLENMWRVAVRAEWVERGETVEEIAETYRYLPLYQVNSRR
ncbi:MAG: hypothetical protein AAGJ79_07900 [Verrucomicrobiota bacterium]